MRRATKLLISMLAVVGGILLAGCGSREPNEEMASGKLRVVAAENFWGSIAQQLGGEQVQVTSIVVNPNTDPHSYEPTAADARTVAGARMAIVNGIGYDRWASDLIGASAPNGRAVLDVGQLLGLRVGDNPHQWYSPSHMRAVVARIVADYERLRPAQAGYFAERGRVFEREGLARYTALIAQIRARYAGVGVGYSESIFQPLGEALGLELLTPPSFAKAIAEGSEVSAQDKQTVDRQLVGRQVKVWVVNSQNLTPDVRLASEQAHAAQIPVVTVTETLAPASDTFEQWQVAQLERLRDALSQATGR